MSDELELLDHLTQIGQRQLLIEAIKKAPEKTHMVLLCYRAELPFQMGVYTLIGTTVPIAYWMVSSYLSWVKHLRKLTYGSEGD